MKIKSIVAEKDIEIKYPLQYSKILAQFKNANKITLDEGVKIEDLFNRQKRPYLKKRQSLNLYLGIKKGELVKPAPPAYGTNSGEHYFFIHAYNCIYECDYCYLQGYFHSPDLVLFLNHEDILKEIEIRAQSSLVTTWFHAGEYSDSLALTHLSGELPLYFELFSRYKNAHLELRSKSVNIRELLKLQPLPNIHISFSLSTHYQAKMHDLGVPSIKHRLIAIQKLFKAGFSIAIHFDPIVYHAHFVEEFIAVVTELSHCLPLSALAYISLGVVRFTEDVYLEVKNNYPDADYFIPGAGHEWSKSFDGKIRYHRPLRSKIFSDAKKILLDHGANLDAIYLCME